MSLEIEAKFRVASHDEVRRRLRAAGADPLGAVVETNAVFDRAGESLRAAGCGLRLRSTVRQDGTAGTATLTFKGPQRRGPLKSREEFEVHLDDTAAMERILCGCGFATVLWYEKRRESWRLDFCRIELDEPPHLGLFVEIEGPSEAAISDVQRRLGLGHIEHERRSYVHMLSEYCRAQGRNDRRLPLPG